ncbi:MAG: hypothetical protein LBK59_10935 [Bifidobacteriaceae bacterium]|jgi:hypothetical protein|nr:hypothetical protein [Bifidobacteriaceae bacterium]
MRWRVAEASVTKHGVALADVRHAVAHLVLTKEYDEGPRHKLGGIGFDRRADALELVATLLDDGDWLFHHCDYARPSFTRWLMT